MDDQKEIIEDILQIENYSIPQDGWFKADGYVIKTNIQKILMVISNGQWCYEKWGYLMSEYNFEEFIGAEILNMERVDKAMKVYNSLPEYMDDGDTVFININTNKGLLQFVAYNSHNGYYGHSVKIISKQLNYETSI